MYNVIFYQDDRGRSPVKEWLDELEKKAKRSKQDWQVYKKVLLYIQMIEEMGTRAGYPYTKSIGDGIWELRPKGHRVFLFVWDGDNIVLLHPFKKKTQKTPRAEIERAKKEMNDWKKYGHERG